MDNKVTVYLRGEITTETPFANSPINSVKQPNGPRLLPRMPVNLGGRWVQVPVIQASTIRGKLRRAAAQVILEKFVEAGLQTQFEDWLLWAVGGVKGTRKDQGISIKERQEIIESSPLLAMFGAGESRAGFVGARFHIDPAIPDQDVETTIVEGARRAENQNPALVEILDPEEIPKVDLYTAANRERSGIKSEIRDLTNAIKKANRNKDKELANSLKSELAALESQQKEAEAAQRQFGSDVTIGMPLAGYEVMGAKAVIPHRMLMQSASVEQIGFVIKALEDFAIDPRIGAHTTSGCGLISGDYNVSVRRTRRGDIETIGQITWDGFTGLKIVGDEIEQWITDWEKAELDLEALRA